MTEGERDGEESNEERRKEAWLHQQSNKATTRSATSSAPPVLLSILSREVTLCFFSLVEKDGEWPAPRAVPLQFLQTSGLSYGLRQIAECSVDVFVI